MKAMILPKSEISFLVECRHASHLVFTHSTIRLTEISFSTTASGQKLPGRCCHSIPKTIIPAAADILINPMGEMPLFRNFPDPKYTAESAAFILFSNKMIQSFYLTQQCCAANHWICRNSSWYGISAHALREPAGEARCIKTFSRFLLEISIRQITTGFTETASSWPIQFRMIIYTPVARMIPMMQGFRPRRMAYFA